MLSWETLVKLIEGFSEDCLDIAGLSRAGARLDWDRLTEGGCVGVRGELARIRFFSEWEWWLEGESAVGRPKLPGVDVDAADTETRLETNILDTCYSTFLKMSMARCSLSLTQDASNKVRPRTQRHRSPSLVQAEKRKKHERATNG